MTAAAPPLPMVKFCRWRHNAHGKAVGHKHGEEGRGTGFLAGGIVVEIAGYVVFFYSCSVTFMHNP